MLAFFPGIKINLVSPPNLAMPAEVVQEVKKAGMRTSYAPPVNGALKGKKFELTIVQQAFPW